MYNNPYNFYPYMNQMPMGSLARGAAGGSNVLRSAARPGLFRSLSNIKWGNVLTNTQKTLNVINQAIPVYYQIKPIWGNLKSFGKIMSAFNEPDNQKTNNQVNNLNQSFNNHVPNQTIHTREEKKEESSNLPTFFIN